MAELLTVEEALARVLERARPLASETVDLVHATGRVLAEPARARSAVPPFASSAMDGFAVRAADCPGELPVQIRIAAGKPSPRPLRVGEAMGIATGGVVPEGADAVVPLERVTETANTVGLPAGISVGENVRPAGGDVAEGAEVLPAGTIVGPAQLAALAASGAATLLCSQQPRVAVVATGSELREPGQTLHDGEIYESNTAMLAAAIAAAGARIEHVARIPDDADAHRREIERGLELDLLVTSGGVSVGPHDLVRRVEKELGVEEVFWGVAMRPGKPISFGRRGDTLVFGLPGNPVSSLVGATLFVCPAVRAMQGAMAPAPHWQPGTLDAALPRNPVRDDFARARVTNDDSEVRLVPIVGQESHMIVRTARADALVHVPRGSGELAQGDSVRFLLL